MFKRSSQRKSRRASPSGDESPSSTWNDSSVVLFELHSCCVMSMAIGSCPGKDSKAFLHWEVVGTVTLKGELGRTQVTMDSSQPLSRSVLSALAMTIRKWASKTLWARLLCRNIIAETQGGSRRARRSMLAICSLSTLPCCSDIIISSARGELLIICVHIYLALASVYITPLPIHLSQRKVLETMVHFPSHM